MADLVLDKKIEEIEKLYRGRYSKSELLEGAFEAEDFFHRVGGSGLWLYFTAVPLLNNEGEIVGAIETLQDVTRRKTIENELNSYKNHLEDLVKLRTREAEEEKERAEIASRIKTDFLANMSHEIRTPLTAIIGFTQMVSDGLLGPVTERQEESLHDVLLSSRHLLSVIEDVLDISAVESGKIKINLSDFYIQELMDNAEIIVSDKVYEKKIKLSISNSSGINKITADERKVKQIIFNLLSNAIKFTPAGGSVEVTVKDVPDRTVDIPKEVASLVRDKKAVIFSVKDTGIGIEEKDRSRIFEKFVQLESPLTKTQPGIGLGLSLSRELARILGGDLWFISKGKDKGSTFFFVLPLNN